MGQKDLNFKAHISRDDHFADLFNGILFRGKEIIKANELEEAEPEIIVRIDDKKMTSVIPDKVRKWRGRNMAVLVVEHQSYVDYRMVLRAMLVETYGYLKQLLTGMKFDLDKIKTVNENGEEVYDMCRAFEEEREIGIEIGKEEMLSTLINNLMDSLKVSMQEAKMMLKISETNDIKNPA